MLKKIAWNWRSQVVWYLFCDFKNDEKAWALLLLSSGENFNLRCFFFQVPFARNSLFVNKILFKHLKNHYSRILHLKHCRLPGRKECLPIPKLYSKIQTGIRRIDRQTDTKWAQLLPVSAPLTFHYLCTRTKIGFLQSDIHP